MLSKSLQKTLHTKKIPFNVALIHLRQHCTAKSFCDIVKTAPDNIAQKKILFNVALILLGQHYTGKNLFQCCPTGSRQHGTGKSTVQYCFNTFGTTLHW